MNERIYQFESGRLVRFKNELSLLWDDYYVENGKLIEVVAVWKIKPRYKILGGKMMNVLNKTFTRLRNIPIDILKQ